MAAALARTAVPGAIEQVELDIRSAGRKQRRLEGDAAALRLPVVLIDSPGTRALPRAKQNPDAVMNPVKIAEAFYYLHTQDKSCWTHELQLTPFATRPSF